MQLEQDKPSKFSLSLFSFITLVYFCTFSFSRWLWYFSLFIKTFSAQCDLLLKLHTTPQSVRYNERALHVKIQQERLRLDLVLPYTASNHFLIRKKQGNSLTACVQWSSNKARNSTIKSENLTKSIIQLNQRFCYDGFLTRTDWSDCPS